MMGTIHYRILSADGSLSGDTFVTAPDQPETIKDDCLLVIDEITGQQLTVHGTRLFPAESPSPSALKKEPRSMCLDCGRVSGVVEDAVVCPLHGDEAACVFVQSHTG